jgi:hypothetical protein
MKVKIFNRPILRELEEEIQRLLDKEEIEIISCTQSVSSCNDKCFDGTICNQWTEYMCIIFYEELTITQRG